MILGLWTSDVFRHEGKFYRTGAEVSLVPTPPPDPHPPIHVAAVCPETVDLYAERGLPILADPAATFRKVVKAAETWRETAAAAGHDSGHAELVVARSVYVAADGRAGPRGPGEVRGDLRPGPDLQREERAHRPARPARPPRASSSGRTSYLKGGRWATTSAGSSSRSSGTPQRVIGQIQMLQEAGFRNLLCDFGSTRPMPLEEMKQGHARSSPPRSCPPSADQFPREEPAMIHTLTLSDVLGRARPQPSRGARRWSTATCGSAYPELDARVTRLADALAGAGA